MNAERIRRNFAIVLLCATFGIAAPSAAQVIQQIMDATGDGLGAVLDDPEGIALDSNGNLYVASAGSDNVFKITSPHSTASVSLLANLPGVRPYSIGVDGAGNVFVMGIHEDTVQKIAPNGTVTTVLTALGDGAGNPFGSGAGLAVGANGVVYAAGRGCTSGVPGPCGQANQFASVFRITPSALPELVLDKTGNGLFASPTSEFPSLAVDSQGNLYAASNHTSHIVKVTPANDTTIAIDFDAEPRFFGPITVATDLEDNLLTITEIDRLFRVTPGGSISEILYQDPPSQEFNLGIAAGPGGAIYLAANSADHVIQILPGGTHSVIIDGTGDGANPFEYPSNNSIAVSPSGTVYVSGSFSHNVFRIVPDGPFLLAKQEQKCVNALNKGLRKVSAKQGREYLSCVKDASKGDLAPQTIEGCVAADRKSKVQKARDRVVADDAKHCSSVTPPYGATDAGVVNASAVNLGSDVFRNLFGTDMDAAVVLNDAPTKTIAACQGKVAKAVARCEETYMKEFEKCKKKGLKDGSIASSAGIVDCVGADLRGKIAKACGPTNGKVHSNLETKCSGVDLAASFPGRCSAATDAVSAALCLDQAARCAACRAAKIADDLAIDCDIVDDSAANQSCVPICGDGFTEDPEECDDGNSTSEDGCSELCVVESCGDGVVQPGLGESCDDSNNDDYDGCSAGCLTEVCGDGVANDFPNEECDGADELLCPGSCQPDCQCSVPITVGTHQCVAADSSFMLTVDSSNPTDTAAIESGILEVDCGQIDPLTGRAQCACQLLEDLYAFPMETLAVCLAPTGESCATGTIDCDGGDQTDVDLVSEHDIGTCTSHSDCAAQCDAHCAGLGGESVIEAQCEGRCLGGADHDLVCDDTSDCPGGQCIGLDITFSVPHPDVCGCTCRTVVGAPTASGGLSCQVAVEVVVENSAPCGDGDIFLSLGTQCMNLTSGQTAVTLLETNFGTVGPITVAGAPKGCHEIGITGLGSLALTGAFNQIHGPAGSDLSLVYSLGCE